MVRRIATWAMLVVVILGTGCGTATPSRLDAYLGYEGAKGEITGPLPSRPVHAALVVVTDQTAPGAAPPPPEGAVMRLGEQLQQQLSSMTPLAISKVLPGRDIEPYQDPRQFMELGKQHGVDYVLVTIVSATEQEYPMTVFLGWVSHAQPGWRRDNWTLLELALIDVRNGETLVRAKGVGWATLDRPSAPGINQWYPVIWLRPEEPARRFWPPSYHAAPATLRVVAMNEAAKRVVHSLQEAWIKQQDAALAAKRG